MHVHAGNSAVLGATPDADGVNFALYSGVAERVELCLFGADEVTTLELPACDDGVWHGYVAGCKAGQRYAYRIHGAYSPADGLFCNPEQLVFDPYARLLDDSGAHILGVVTDPVPERRHQRPAVDWADTIIYEANVRGFTMRHPDVDEKDRGRFSGLSNNAAIQYLKALGITTIELMPVQAFVDEPHLHAAGLRNYWGYNTISFFAPANRYAGQEPINELVDAIRTIHDAGLEVVLDVAYNHTGEGAVDGPTMSFRGIDNLAYYRTEEHSPGTYINDTGCGNTINADHPRVRQLVLDSLSYFHRDIGFDGFRFDLAPILGRHADRFTTLHPLLQRISSAPSLAGARLIAEPWDPGPGGYQLGHFPDGWAEWNDRFRDDVRAFWRGDPSTTGSLANRLHGSSEIFERRGRLPTASVNFVACHDGFTLNDTVSYKHRHNEANGENNRDGHSHNFSANYGVEGPSEDVAINAIRRRQRLNMLATTLLAQGVPMLLAGDEFGHSQDGNNNAYAQDNETGWLDWSGLDLDPEFTRSVRELIALRLQTPLLRLPVYVHGKATIDGDEIEIDWINAGGHSKRSEEWLHSHAFTMLIRSVDAVGRHSGVAIMINGRNDDIDMHLPETGLNWSVAFHSSQNPPSIAYSRPTNLQAHSIAVLTA
jgi:glycogen operon protein